jgi:hypothetical protein
MVMNGVPARPSAPTGRVRNEAVIRLLTALATVGRRRQRRGPDRTPTEVAARAGGEIVQIVDLTPSGAGLIAPHAVSLGQRLELVAQLPESNGGTHPVRLCLTVATCCTDDAGPDRWRVGGTITPVGIEDHDRLVAYCHLAGAQIQLVESGRLQPTATEDPLELPLSAEHRSRRQRRVASGGGRARP